MTVDSVVVYDRSWANSTILEYSVAKHMLQSLRTRARALKKETAALYMALRDPRTPWLARAVALLTLAYALSPIDLIPDFVPVLGYLDDLVIVPAGIALAIRLIPPEVMAEARVTAANSSGRRGALGWVGAAFIVIIWIAALVWVLHLLDLF
jgi:uncharacterized membrane protein YkvA (DUF1232 family)